MLIQPHAYDIAIKRQRELSARDGEIIQHITQWEYIRQLWPTLICRNCWRNVDPPGNADQQADWEVTLRFGSHVEAECHCTKWCTAQPASMTPWLGQRFVPFKDAVTMFDEETPILTQKNEPLTEDEAALLQAWKRVMESCRWSEALQCNACFASANKTGISIDASVHGVVVPGRFVELNCNCSRREWHHG